MDKIDIEELQKKMKKRLPRKRYQHTQGVRYTAAALAMRYGADIQAASIAGLLHDCAKYLSEEEILEECKRYQIPCSGTEREKPYLLHAKLGACYARQKYKIDREDILLAIQYHTTGRPGMSLLEKIIFTADYIEPGRKPLPGLPAIRQMAFCDLDEAVYMILRDTLDYLEHSDRVIDDTSRQSFDYYQKLRTAANGPEA